MEVVRNGEAMRAVEKPEEMKKMGMDFFYDKLKLPEDKDILVSEQFCEKDKPILWKIKAITEDEFLRAGKSADKWASLCVASVSMPNLKDKELWESYGVRSGEDALKEMLCPGEFLHLLEAVKLLNDFPKRQEERKAEAKNAFGRV